VVPGVKLTVAVSPDPDPEQGALDPDALGQRFLAGFALYMGPRAYNLDNSLYAMPIDQLWGRM
jgi:hypothetical protein